MFLQEPNIDRNYVPGKIRNAWRKRISAPVIITPFFRFLSVQKKLPVWFFLKKQIRSVQPNYKLDKNDEENEISETLICEKWDFKNTNFVKIEISETWILSKLRFWKCGFCENWDFRNVNFAENEILGKWILWKMRFQKGEFSKNWIFNMWIFG